MLTTIRCMASNDITRKIRRTGVDLTWAELDTMGEDCVDWLTHRLQMTCTSFDWGCAFSPKGNS